MVVAFGPRPTEHWRLGARCLSVVEASSTSMVSPLVCWCLSPASQTDIPIERLSLSTCPRPRVAFTQGESDMAQRVDPTRHRADGTPIEPLIKHPNAAGIDIGGASHYVAVPPDRVGKGEHAVCEFWPHTEVRHSRECGNPVKSTYWIAAFAGMTGFSRRPTRTARVRRAGAGRQPGTMLPGR
jgi:hypothetical protein